MSDAAQQKGAQQFAIATAFTCRSVIKYNSSLSEEQKKERIADIDSMVRFLRDRSLAHAPIEAHVAPAQRQQTAGRPSNANVNADKAAGKVGEADDKKYKQQLSEVYRITQLYLSKKNSDGTSEFMARFQQAMASIDEVQVITMQSRPADLYPSPKHMEDLLEDIRGCVTDVYAIFIEFARAISNALQGSGIYIDTEEMSSVYVDTTCPERSMGQAKQKQGIADISPLLKVYETHVQFNEKKGTIASRIEDATAFLMFLGENLGSYDGRPQGPTLHIPTTLAPTDKRDMIVVQLNKVAKLLNDLSCLLSNYESTMSALLQQG